MGRGQTKEQVGGRRREGWERRKKEGGGGGRRRRKKHKRIEKRYVQISYPVIPPEHMGRGDKCIGCPQCCPRML